jgi:acyl-CoA hydrolase
MDNYTIVRPEHLNHHGVLFGGHLLQWVDEFAWLVASLDYPGSKIVTRAMESVDFHTQVLNGSILRFHIEPHRQGDTSVTYAVEVYADAPGEETEKLVFSNRVTFVSVDEAGRKRALPKKDRLRSQDR